VVPRDLSVRAATDIAIDEAELISLALELGNIDSPLGQEGEAGEFVFDWLHRNGFSPRKLAMIPERFNVLGKLPGTGNGYSLIYNSHLDSARNPAGHWSLRDTNTAENRGARLKGNVLQGESIINEKAPMAAFLVAAKSIMRSGRSLRGDLLLSAVAGEIGMEPVDEFAAPQYLSKEVGTRYLVQHGGVADFALVAEGTDFRYAAIEPGKAFFKVIIYGDKQTYTPYTSYSPPSADHPNAIVRAALVVTAIQEWAGSYERRYRTETSHGTIVPKVGIGAIRGGTPYFITRTSEVCAVYVDVRLVPDQDPLSVRDELSNILGSLGIAGTVELFVYRRAYEPGNLGPFIESLRNAHARVVGGELEVAEPVVSSMWRDVSVFNEMGIPSITYGPRRDFNEESMTVDDLVLAARVYAELAVELCNREKPVAAGNRRAR
jgi:acetylornithine deacetylase/succinyl-diaminopimelate desuccinylase-like protein